jgi:hypothetical protein
LANTICGWWTTANTNLKNLAKKKKKKKKQTHICNIF